MKTASEVKNSSRARTLAHETRKSKQGLVMFVMNVANHNGTMEADTISKTGEVRKRLTSRGTIINVGG